ncbi:MAG: HlyD family efflux transporter periplasmic adaptor subunit [Byssovorax sp.]
MKTWIKRSIGVLAALGVAAGVAYSYAPKPLPIDAETVDRGPIRVEVEGDGKTRVQHRYTVSAPITGVLSRPELRAGDPVKEGAPILDITPVASPLLDVRSRAQAEAQVKVAVAMRAQAEGRRALTKQALALARTDFDRQQKLFQSGALPRASLDEAELRLRTAEQDDESTRLGIAVATSQQRAAEAALTGGAAAVSAAGKVAIEAPQTGAVLRIFQESGGVVAAGTPILEIGDRRDLEVVVDLLSTDAVNVHPGAEATIERWGGDGTLAAEVRYVEPSGFTKLSALGVEEQRVNVLLDFTGSAEARAALGDGYRVETKVVIFDLQDVVRVPLSALFRDGEQWAAFVVDQGSAHMTHLLLGRRNQRHAEVLRGLSEGDRVVAHPGDRLRDGLKVTPRPAPAAASGAKVAGP